MSHLEEAGFMTYTAARHQGAIIKIWLHFLLSKKRLAKSKKKIELFVESLTMSSLLQTPHEQTSESDWSCTVVMMWSTLSRKPHHIRIMLQQLQAVCVCVWVIEFMCVCVCVRLGAHRLVDPVRRTEVNLKPLGSDSLKAHMRSAAPTCWCARGQTASPDGVLVNDVITLALTCLQGRRC